MTSVVPTGLLNSVRRMDASRRFGTGAVLLVTLAGLWLLVRWVNEPTWVPLYSERLTPSEQGAITDQLEAIGARYDFGPGGDQIRVAASELARLRVEMARLELGIGGCGAGAAFPLGAGNLQQQMMRKRSIQDHLACTIGQMEGVDRAQVHLALPERSPFRRAQEPATASVVVWPRRGGVLNVDAVRGITLLVSGAVENLGPDQVSVINARGNTMIAAGIGGTAGGRTAHELSVREEVERHLAAKAERLLASMLAPGEFQVQVAAELDFTKIERTKELFDPEAQAIIREGTSEIPPGATGAGSPPYTSEERESRYSRTLESITTSPGSVRRLSVAVLVDEGAEVFGAAGAAAPTANRQIARIDSVVRNAVGLDVARGDHLIVTALPFLTVDDSMLTVAPAEPGVDIVGLIERFSRPAVGLIGIVAGLVLALKALALVRSAAPGPNLRPAAAATGGGAAPSTAGEAQPTLPPKIDATAALSQEVATETTSSPETAARVVRAWLSESPS